MQLVYLQPLISEEEFEKTTAAVTEFGAEGGVGEELQRLLHERAKTKDSWVRVNKQWLPCVSMLLAP